MSGLLKTLINPLVNHPEDINIQPAEQGNTVVLEVRVNPEDMGKVIGKGGRRAEALRTVMKAQATRLGRRVVVDILD
ncbi:KH domain-containing protein [Oscillospiraceae bacterium HV4-5-C5C]|nr:KH domain-containing protein [Oscillospiraceae bacterium HV4-5-C5C]